MATNVTWNNTSYSVPASGETGWQALSDFLIDLGNNAAVANVIKQANRVATSSPVTVSNTTDCVVVCKLSVAGAVTVNLPAGATGRWFAILDGTGDAATNNVTIDANASETINGATTYVISDNFGGVVIAWNGTQWNVVSRYIGGAVLTNPYADGFMIDGAADEVQLKVQGHSTQTSNLVELENSSAADLVTVTGGGRVDIYNGTIGLVVGADSASVSRTNATRKISRIGAPHYTNSEEPVGIILVDADTATTAMGIGGGTSAMNAPTQLDFYTAANNTTTSGTSRLTISSAGAASFSGDLSVTGIGGNVHSSTYTPTLTGVTNVAASAASVCNYMRIQNQVIVYGRMTVDPTLATTATQIDISLPIASDLTNIRDLSGTGVIEAEFDATLLLADTTNNRASCYFFPTSLANREHRFSFMYLVQ